MSGIASVNVKSNLTAVHHKNLTKIPVLANVQMCKLVYMINFSTLKHVNVNVNINQCVQVAKCLISNLAAVNVYKKIVHLERTSIMKPANVNATITNTVLLHKSLTMTPASVDVLLWGTVVP